MKKYKSIELLDQLQSDVRELLVIANYLRSEDPEYLLEQPAPGKWSAVQVLEHLNSYGRYYLPAIEKSLQENTAAAEIFRPGWLGDYFTKLMSPSVEGLIKNKMKAPKNHRPLPCLDSFTVLNEFVAQQQTLLDLLETAKSKNIGAIRTPVSISKFIRLKVGDTFRFLIAHEQRHFIQLSMALKKIQRKSFFSIAV
jgi:hypothetical protein